MKAQAVWEATSAGCEYAEDQVPAELGLQLVSKLPEMR